MNDNNNRKNGEPGQAAQLQPQTHVDLSAQERIARVLESVDADLPWPRVRASADNIGPKLMALALDPASPHEVRIEALKTIHRFVDGRAFYDRAVSAMATSAPHAFEAIVRHMADIERERVALHVVPTTNSTKN
jgi:hypothetical protein